MVSTAASLARPSPSRAPIRASSPPRLKSRSTLPVAWAVKFEVSNSKFPSRTVRAPLLKAQALPYDPLLTPVVKALLAPKAKQAPSPSKLNPSQHPSRLLLTPSVVTLLLVPVSRPLEAKV